MELVEQQYRAKLYENQLKKQHDIELDKLEEMQGKAKGEQDEGAQSSKNKKKKNKK